MKLGFKNIVAEMSTDFIIVMVIFNMQKYDDHTMITMVTFISALQKRFNSVGSGGGGLLLLLLGVGGGGGAL